MKNKRVVLTGASGFVGMNLVRNLVEAGNEVCIFLRPSSNIEQFNDIKKQISIYKGNFLEDPDLLIRTCKDISPQVLIHGSAYGTRPYRLGRPFQTDLQQMIATNILGTANVINACKDLNLELFINFGSSSEYGIYDSPMYENGPTNPVNLYGVTKVCASHLVNVMGKELGCPVYTLRLFSIYGPFEDPTRLIPTLLLGALHNKTISLSSPNPVRDYVFVGDIIKAINCIWHKIPPSGIYNICSGQQWSVADAVKATEKITGKELTVHYGEMGMQPNEPSCWVGDPQKLKALGWQPTHFYDGLLETYTKFREGYGC